MDELIVSIFATQGRVFGITGVMLLLLAEAGYRTGRPLFVKHDESRKTQISGVQGAVLGLLALLLGFTFSMSVGRYDNRRDLVLQEANSIGTTYLRASFLPAPHRTAVEDLLRKYVDVRLDFFRAGSDAAKLNDEEGRAAALQGEIWSHAVAGAKEDPSPVVATFINALNDMIDMDATRLHAMRAKVPGAAWLLLLVVAGVGCYVSGYSAGASGARNIFTNVLLPALIAVVITIIADFSRPQQGLILISQEPLLDLKTSISPTPTH